MEGVEFLHRGLDPEPAHTATDFSNPKCLSAAEDTVPALSSRRRQPGARLGSWASREPARRVCSGLIIDLDRTPATGEDRWPKESQKQARRSSPLYPQEFGNPSLPCKVRSRARARPGERCARKSPGQGNRHFRPANEVRRKEDGRSALSEVFTKLRLNLLDCGPD